MNVVSNEVVSNEVVSNEVVSNEVVSNQCGLKWLWSQMNVVSNECDCGLNSHGTQSANPSTHLLGVSSGMKRIQGVFHNGAETWWHS